MATPIVAGQHSAANPSNEAARASNLATLARQHGLSVERKSRFDVYTGTAEQLIAAALVQPGMFPGDPGRGLTMVSYAEDGTQIPRGNSRFQTSLRVQKIGRKFKVTVYVSMGERRRRQAEREASDPEVRARAERAAEAIDFHERRLKELPATRDDYIANACDEFWTWIQVFHGKHCQASPTESGYRLSALDEEVFLSAARATYRAIQESETAYFPQYRYRKLNEARSTAAKADPRLQSFIRHVVATPLHEPIEDDRQS